MTQLTSHSGLLLDTIAFGTYQIAPGEETYKAVSEAMEVGYSSIDTAKLYGNEQAIGRAISSITDRHIHVTTKVWNSDQGYEKAIDAGRRSRDLLQVPSIDLLLIHWPGQDKKKMLETWRAFHTLREEGTVSHIGVSNFTNKHIEILEQRGFSRPSVNQIELNPLFTQEKIRVFCQNKGIIVEGWRPLVHGEVHKLEPLQVLADKYQKTLVQVVIRWAILSGIRVLAKSTKKARMIENIDVFDFDLTSEEMDLVDSMNQNYRSGPDPETFFTLP